MSAYSSSSLGVSARFPFLPPFDLVDLGVAVLPFGVDLGVAPPSPASPPLARLRILERRCVRALAVQPGWCESVDVHSV